MMKVLDRVDAFIARLGKLVSYLILIIIGVIVFELVSRTAFDKPSPWAHDVGAWLQVAFIFLGGAYALQQDQFVRIDLLYMRYGPKTKAIVDAVAATLLFALFAYILIARGYDFALKSYVRGETSATGGWDGPVFISKALVPIGGVLLAFAWISKVIRSVKAAFGREG